jgi:hypothetical protein
MTSSLQNLQQLKRERKEMKNELMVSQLVVAAVVLLPPLVLYL